MKEHVLHLGDCFETELGDMRVIGFNEVVVYLEEFRTAEDGELRYWGERILTRYEIAEEFRKLDGLPHIVRMEGGGDIDDLQNSDG